MANRNDCSCCYVIGWCLATLSRHFQVWGNWIGIKWIERLTLLTAFKSQPRSIKRSIKLRRLSLAANINGVKPVAWIIEIWNVSIDNFHFWKWQSHFFLENDAKMSQKWQKKDRKMTWKWHEKLHKKDTKKTQKGRTVTSKMTWKWQKKDRKMTWKWHEKWHKNDRKKTQKWFENDLKMTEKSRKNDRKKTWKWHEKWHKNDTKMTWKWGNLAAIVDAVSKSYSIDQILKNGLIWCDWKRSMDLIDDSGQRRPGRRFRRVFGRWLWIFQRFEGLFHAAPLAFHGQ